jgi:hypothetical protein
LEDTSLFASRRLDGRSTKPDLIVISEVIRSRDSKDKADFPHSTGRLSAGNYAANGASWSNGAMSFDVLIDVAAGVNRTWLDGSTRFVTPQQMGAGNTPLQVEAQDYRLDYKNGAWHLFF